MASISAISSKHPQKRGENEFYRYYAGYPIEFAEWAISRLALGEGAIIFDPWNGSGTTVAACAKMGISAKGFDINPVMVHLGRARIAAAEEFQEAIQLVQSVAAECASAGIKTLTGIGETFRSFPVGDEAAHSVAITALYPLAPVLYGFAKSKNPTWFSSKRALKRRPVDRQCFFDEWQSLIKQLSQWAVATTDQGVVLSVERADSRRTYGRAEMFDGLLTSPPYLTRIDYVKATLPEFTLLSDFDSVPDSQRLRRSMLGTPLTSSDREIEVSEFPPRLAKTLTDIRTHESKASSTYYFKFFSAYFFDLKSSLKRIHRALKPGALACFVVQPSSYKEILVDLPDCLVEISEVEGFSHAETISFDVNRSMSLVNSKAHASARSPKSEYAVFLRRN